jgi:tetratricopeptide (TPR) repeat protein
MSDMKVRPGGPGGNRPENLTGHNLLGFLQYRRISVEGINPGCLRNLPFDLASFNARFGTNFIKRIIFPLGIELKLLRYVFSVAGLPDLILTDNEIKVELIPLGAISVPVLGKKALIDSVLTTKSVRVVLEKAPLVILGDDFKLDIENMPDGLRTAAESEPLVLGTRLNLDNFNEMLLLLKRPEAFLFLLKNHRDMIPSVRRFLERMAEVCEDRSRDKPANEHYFESIRETARLLTEKERMQFMQELKKRSHWEAFAVVEQAQESLSDEQALFFARAYFELGTPNLEAAETIAERMGYGKLARRIETEISRRKEKEAAQREVKTVELFSQMVDGKISYEQFIAYAPEDYILILINHSKKQINPNLYQKIRKAAGIKEMFYLLLDKVAEQLYSKVREGVLFVRSEEGKVLDLILDDRELFFLPPAEWMADIERKALKEKPYLPAKAIYDSLIGSHLKKAREAEGKKQWDEAWQEYESALEINPQSKQVISETANMLYRQAENAKERKTANERLEKLILLDPENPILLSKLAYFNCLEDNYAVAIEYSEKAKRLNSVDSNNLEVLETAYHGRYFQTKNTEDLEKSLAAILDVLRFNPQSKKARFDLSLVHYDRSEYAKAAESIGRLLEIVDGPRIFMAFLSHVCDTLDDTEAPTEEIVKMIRGIRVKRANAENDEMADFLFLIVKFMEKGRIEAARELIDKFGTLGMPAIQKMSRGIYYHYLASYEKAAAQFRELIADGPMLFKLNDFLGRKVPLAEEAAYNLFDVLAEMGGIPAENEAEQLARRFPSAISFCSLGDIYEKKYKAKQDQEGADQGKSEKELAINYYQKAAEIDPLFVPAYLDLLPLHRIAKDEASYAAALSGLKSAVEKAIRIGRIDMLSYQSIYFAIFDELKERKSPLLLEVKEILRSELKQIYQQFVAVYRAKYRKLAI